MNKTNRSGNGNGSASLEDSESRSLEVQQTEVHDVKEAEKSFGRINIEDDQSNYVGSTHWVAILDNVGHSIPPNFCRLVSLIKALHVDHTRL